MAYDPSNPFGSTGTSSPYDAMRRQAVQRSQSAGQDSMDAMNRRFASMGNLNSGANIKAIQTQGIANQNQLENTMGNIDMSENEQGNKLAEAEKQRAFQGGEAEKQRKFQGDLQTNLQAKSLAQQESQFGREMPMRQQALDQEAKRLDLESQAQSFNEGMAQWQQGHSGGLLGAGGFLGTGIGI